ncbi:TIGR03086 family metal-binding protein [Nocardia thailandica]|uniref:TIGR03086 family metal-binding protein n=1 Tax=Nocardia thailandica TaxID=257275 RepID=A0ABW6PTF0_9NOCA
MQPSFAFDSAADALAAVTAAITDDQLADPTPCADVTVRDLLAHAVGLTEAFRQAAAKESVGTSAPPQTGPDTPLPAEWRALLPGRLKALAEAWRDPAAWDGDAEAGGVTMPAPVMAMVALDELVVHAWDLAVATGQSPRASDADLAVLLEFLRETDPEGTPGLFGPVIPVAPEAPLLDQVLGLTGRDAAWSR